MKNPESTLRDIVATHGARRTLEVLIDIASEYPGCPLGRDLRVALDNYEAWKDDGDETR